MKRAQIVGVGSYAPKRILRNHDLEQMVETTDEWIVQRSGIRERHVADPVETKSDLAVAAAQQALDRATIVPADVDLIIVGTTSPDMPFPSTATFIPHKLGCGQAGAVDLSAACAGSVYSMSIGAQYIGDGEVSYGPLHRRRDTLTHHGLDGSRDVRAAG